MIRLHIIMFAIIIVPIIIITTIITSLTVMTSIAAITSLMIMIIIISSSSSSITIMIVLPHPHAHGSTAGCQKLNPETNRPGPWEIGTFEGHFEVSVHPVRNPRFVSFRTQPLDNLGTS